jgi:serine/threonine protein kinase
MGTYLYVAPEVIKKNYGVEVDAWSTGVVLYIMLSGKIPFKGKSEKEVFKRILYDDPVLEGDGWDNVPCEAKNLLS